MIGIYGIFENKTHHSEELRLNAFKKMTESVDSEDFNSHCYHSGHFSIGITLRNVGENRDLALKRINEDVVIAFCGYGKFFGEKKLYWADEMIDRISLQILQGNTDTLKKIEGSFHCLVIYKDALTMVSDRFSSKNIFYYDGDDFFIFAPDVSRVLSADLVPKRKSIDAAMQILVTGYFLDDSTLAEDIYRFPYASIMKKDIVAWTSAEFMYYWNMPKREGDIDKITPGLIDDFAEILKQSITELVELEPSFILPLSGGLDSRAILCNLYNDHKITAITYALKDEMMYAKQVCNKIGANFLYFSNDTIASKSFSDSLFRIFREQKFHVVINQYFYLPLFREYFIDNSDHHALFNGIYLDELFSSGWPKYDYNIYDLNKYVYNYGGGALDIICPYLTLNKQKFIDLMENIYIKTLKDFGSCDDLAKTQLFYVLGRLRRYVNEALTAQENYCYVFKPGYNYELLDFAWKLKAELRHGILYRKMLDTKYPKVMSVKYKDSYGNRPKYLSEKIKNIYVPILKKLSLASGGIIKYTPHQVQYYFLKENNMDEYKRLFFQENRLTELIDDSARKYLFDMVTKKFYYFEFSQRLLFLQQFFMKHNI